MAAGRSRATTGRGPTELLLKFMNLGRQHSFAFFEPYLSPPILASPFIPYENLGTSELPQLGAIGKEIYGAGEVFWLYLLFEALAHSDAPDICTVYLDLLEAETLKAFPPARRRLIVYNPTPEARDFQVQFDHPAQQDYTVVQRSPGSRPGAAVHLDNATLPLHLEANQWIEIELCGK